MKHIVNLIIFFQLLLAFPFSGAFAGVVEEKLTGNAKKLVTNSVCGSGNKGSYACTVLDVTVSDEDFLEEVVNLVLIFSIIISLLDSSCEVVKEADEDKIKPYTAGITHWIHKLAGLIYIYGEIQNLVTLRGIDSDYEDAAKVEGQLNKFQALKDMLIAKKDAAESKLKVLNIAGLGFATSAAVDVGMSAAFTAWGGYRQVSEATSCTLGSAELTSCGVPAAGSGATVAGNMGYIKDTVEECTSVFAVENLSGMLMAEAKSQVMGAVKQGIGGLVGGLIGNKITEKAGGGKVAQIAGTASGVYIGAQVSKKIESIITDSTDFFNSDDQTLSKTLKEQPKKCIEESTKKIIDRNIKSLALSGTVDGTCGSVVGAMGCPAAIAASCAFKTILATESCHCFVRNSAQIAPTLLKITNNFSYLSKIDEDAASLGILATDFGADTSLHSLRVSELQQSAGSFQGMSEQAAKALADKLSKETCGIDYTNWPIRHDLECSPRFAFLTEEDTDEVTVDVAEKMKTEGEQGKTLEETDQSQNDSGAVVGENGVEPVPTFNETQNGEYGTEAERQAGIQQANDMATDQALSNALEGSDDNTDEDWQPFNTQEEQDAYEAHKAESEAEMDAATKALVDANSNSDQDSSNTGESNNSSSDISGESNSNSDPLPNYGGSNSNTITPNPYVIPSNEGGNSNESSPLEPVDPTGSLPSKDKVHKTIANVQKTLKEQEETYGHLANMNLAEAIIGLQTSKHAEWMTSIFNDAKLSHSYNKLGRKQQESIRVTIASLLENLKTLKNNVAIPNAHADETSNEVSILGGLGLGVIGILIFPKVIKRVMELNTILHRNPLRRGLYFMTTYFMANSNISTTEKKVSELEDQIAQVQALIEKEQSYDTTFLNYIENLFSIPSAHANVIENNLVPLCVDGTKFSTSCLCKTRGNCGNSITNMNPKSNLFRTLPAYASTSVLQLQFARKMSQGEVTAADYDALQNSLKAYSNKLNPEIAAENLDLILEERGLQRANLVERSKNLVASLQKFGVSEIVKAKNLKIDPSQLFKNNGHTISKTKNVSPNVDKKVISKLPSQTKAVKSTVKASAESTDSLDNYKLNEPVIIDNSALDIFKVITNRYHKIWFSKK